MIAPVNLPRQCVHLGDQVAVYTMYYLNVQCSQNKTKTKPKHQQQVGSGDSSVVRAQDSWSKGRGFSRVNFLCWLLFRYPFHPRVTAVARKRPRSFCSKRRWQVTAKHAHTWRMWLCMKWHGAWLYGVHRTRRDWLSGSRFLWHQPCQRCKYTTSVDIQKRAIKSYSLM